MGINPNNVIVLRGQICSEVRILEHDGEEFAARFDLLVKRNYRSSGEYKCDTIPVRYCPAAEIAKELRKGDLVSLCGSLSSEMYRGEQIWFVKTDSITLESREDGQTVSADFRVNLPLPF